MNSIDSSGKGGGPIAVAIGELAVAKAPAQLRTLLGSCVGVLLLDRRLQLAGLAHVVLPESRGETELPGKYADTAIPELLRQLHAIAGTRVIQPVAKILGGANMFPQITANQLSIGDQNVLAVERALQQARITVVARHCGGTSGRRVLVDAASGTVRLEILGSEPIQV
jgi:chemotaxis protein CheD